MNPLFDPTRKFIRVIQRRSDGLVEFEFAVGEPELFVEMLLPQAAFDDFCQQQGVQASLGGLAGAASGSVAHEWDWTLHQARDQHFRHEP